MATIDGELRTIYEAERDSIAAERSVHARVTRRAARRRLLAASGVVAAAAAFAVGVATTASAYFRTPPPAATPDVVLGEATIPFDRFPVDGTIIPNNEYEPIAPGLGCGAPAPTPVSSEDGISWDVGRRDEISSALPVDATLRYADGELPASVSGMGFVFVQDGVIVGWVAPWQQGIWADYPTLNRDGVPLSGYFSGLGYLCDAHGGGSPNILPDGDYEVYPVVVVTASPEDAARAYLMARGYEVPVDQAEGIAAFVPGSWDCSPGGWAHARNQGMPWVGARPSVLCADGLDGVAVDREAKTVTVPYSSFYYTRTASATLIGEPARYTAPDSAAEIGSYSVEFADPVSDPSALTCGRDVGVNIAMTSPLARTAVASGAIDPSANETLPAGEPARLVLLPTPGTDSSTLAYPDGLRVWLVAHPDPETLAPPNDPEALRPYAYAVVGTATATVGDGAPIPLDRFSGPSRTTVTLTDVQWCDAAYQPALTNVIVSGLERVATAGASSDATILAEWGVDTDSWSGVGGGN